MTKNKGAKATSTRNFLSFLMVIIVIVSAAGFYFGLQLIKTYATDVSHTVSDANASGKNIEKLSDLKIALAEREALVAKANTLFSTPEFYQAQTLNDIKKYATNSGVVVTNIEFDKVEVAAGSATPPTTNLPITVTLQSPVAYNSLLKFLDAVEGNLPKMQVTGVSLGRAGTGDSVTTDKITMTVSTR